MTAADLAKLLVEAHEYVVVRGACGFDPDPQCLVISRLRDALDRLKPIDAAQEQRLQAIVASTPRRRPLLYLVQGEHE